MKNDHKNQIMVIDDNITNLNIARAALECEYEPILVTTGVKALSLLQKLTPDMILLDVEMADMDGFEVIKRLKKLPEPICNIPVIFLTACNELDSELRGLALGAVDYIQKPYSFSLLLKRIDMQISSTFRLNLVLKRNSELREIVDERARQINRMKFAAVNMLSDIAGSRKGMPEGHVYRIAGYLQTLLGAAKEDHIYENFLKDVDTDMLAEASRLYDIGNISIPDKILLKPGKLSPEEFDTVKEHTNIAAEVITGVMSDIHDESFVQSAAAFARSHHERWDGSGYPHALREDSIPIEGRFMAIVDVYDAMTSERPYKHAMSHDAAVDVIMGGSGVHFDPQLVSAFSKVAGSFKKISECGKRTCGDN